MFWTATHVLTVAVVAGIRTNVVSCYLQLHVQSLFFLIFLFFRFGKNLEFGSKFSVSNRTCVVPCARMLV